MSFVSRLFSWLLRRSQMEREMDEELRFHIEQHTENLIRDGIPREEAVRRAGAEFGPMDASKEECRAAVGLRLWDELRTDVRFGLRQLRKNPGFTAVVVTILALGIGMNTAAFTITDAMVFGGMPGVDRNGRILYISTKAGLSYPDFQDWRAQAKSFTDLAAVSVRDLGVSLNDERGRPETADECVLTTNAFQVLGQRPILGRDFVPSDGDFGAKPVTILSYGMWTDRYGRNPSVIGETIRINEVPTEVIGVMPPGFGFPLKGLSLWVPFVPTQLLVGSLTTNFQQRDAREMWFAFGPMAKGITIESARTEMEVIGNRLAIAYPKTNKGVAPRVFTFSEFFVTLTSDPNAVPFYLAMWGAAGFVLLIACANLANLMLARAIGRAREISLRSALGAGRWRIIRQLVIESVMLSTIGGVVGLALAAWSVAAYQRVANPPSNWGLEWTYTMDYRGFAYIFSISAITGLVFGLAPALWLSRLDISAVLKDGGRGSMGGRRGKHSSALLVMGEVALAVVLLAGTGVMIRSLLNVHTANRGVDSANILITQVYRPNDSREAQRALQDRVKTRLEAVPGIESVALAEWLPGGFARQFPFEVAGAPPVDEKQRPAVAMVTISPGYFRTVGASVLSGRPFTDMDGVSGIPVVIVNQRLADTVWPGEDPLGKRLRLFNGETPATWRTVVGIASNIVQNDLTGQTFKPVAYAPYRLALGSDRIPGSTIFVRTRVPAKSLRATILGEIDAIDANATTGSHGQDPRTLDQVWAEISWARAVGTGLLFVFALFGLMLAAFGLYAVVAHSVSQRTQEIGIRVAVGATSGDIRTMVLKQGILPLGSGLIIGLAASFAVNRVLKSQLVGVAPSDPLALLAASAALVLAALLGCWIPARWATRVDPVVALRHE